MKAILVIDVPSDYGDVVDNKAIVTLRNDKLGTSLRIHNVPLKPMPEKIESGKIEDGTKTNIPIPCEHFAMGWNACLEEVENEQNDS